MENFPEVFVTVGTTEFNELLQTIDCTPFVDCLVQLNCKRLFIQMGRGTFDPFLLPAECERRSIEYNCFRFKPTLDDNMRNADLIITHCGAGSIIEAITLHKFYVVVVNNTLQGNHQEELASELSKGHYCVSTIPDQLICELSNVASHGKPRLRFALSDWNPFPAVVDGLFDWGDDGDFSRKNY